ncbi:MAG TPA: glycine cleavage T C-terminal barrel domain-containing protein [Pirellulales bacterium]|nr:glycine cleavage T C-terminal barrel domain-containing protein [Pirellulales bacterium]
MPTADPEYSALTSGAGLVDVSGRTQIELTGDDLATFLHSFTTNDIRGLRPGKGCEAFALDARGHVLGHLLVFCTPHSLVVDTVPEQGEKLIRHLERYLIREQVEIHDRTDEWGELLLAGSEAEQLLHDAAVTVPAGRLEHEQAQLAWQTVWIRRVDMAGPRSFLIAGERGAIDALVIALAAEGATPCTLQTFETVRIEASFPWYGRDITDKNLAQEVNRDRLAISLTKGCYLGQETVARIDALGHVNKTLQSVRFSGGTVPPAGSELRCGQSQSGEVTSATYSPHLNAPLGLAYIRRGLEAIGTKLDSDYGEAEVIARPLG